MSLLRRRANRQEHWPWRRLWVPREITPPLDSAGFLHDASWLRVVGIPEPLPLDAFADVPCVVALGDPGLGKSHAVEDYAAGLATRVPRERLLALDLREFGSRDEVLRHVFQAPIVETWAGHGDPVHLVLDSLDESPIPVETLCGLILDELERLFERLPATRMRLLIACRTAVMPRGFVQSLRTLFTSRVAPAVFAHSATIADSSPASGVSAIASSRAGRLSTGRRRDVPASDSPATDPLLPAPGDARPEPQPGRAGVDGCVVVEITVLRRDDARAAAASVLRSNDAAGAFLEAVIDANVGAFAARPITLRALLARHQAGRPLRGSQADLYRDLCRELCESVASRPGTLPAHRIPRTTLNERYRIAGRLAAAMLFGNLRGVWCGEGPPTSAELLDPRDCDGTERVDGTVLRVDAVTTAEALNTALFTGRTGHPAADEVGGALGAHQTFAEFLAADWAWAHEMELPQLLSLLHDPTDPERRVVPQLRQVAAWLASVHSGVFDALASGEPELLLSSDVVHVPDERREALVTSLLTRTADNRVVRPPFGARLAYDRLGHPRLAVQLGRAIGDSTLPERVRDRALDMARACRVEALGAVGAELAFDEREPLDLRVAAATFVAEVGGEPERWMLMPLVAQPPDADDADELRGAALWASWKLFTPDELFSLLARPRRPNWSGAYGIALREIAAGLTSDYVVAGARWLARLAPGSSTGALDEIAEATLSLALEHVADVNVRAPLLTYVRRRLRKHMRLGETLTGKLPQRVQETLDQSRDTRRRLVTALLDSEPGWPAPGTPATGAPGSAVVDSSVGVDGALFAHAPADLESALEVDLTANVRWLGHDMPELFSSADVPWALEVLAATPNGADQRTVWREAIRFLFHPAEPTHLEAALRYRGDADVAYATLDWSTYQSLEAATEALLLARRAAQEAEAAREATQQARAAKDESRRPEPLADRITRRLSTFAKSRTKRAGASRKEPTAAQWSLWAQLFFELVLEPKHGRHFGAEPSPETLATLGETLAADDLQRVIDAALAHLNKEPAAQDPYPADGQLPWTTLHGATAALLVARLAPSRLAEVTPAAWREWLPTLVRSEPFGGNPDNAPVETLLTAAALEAPEAFRIVLLEATDSSLRDPRRRVSTPALQLALTTPALAQELARRAAARAFGARETETLLRRMLRAGGEIASEARHAAAALLADIPATPEEGSSEPANSPAAASRREAGIAAAAALVAGDEDAGWALVGTRLVEDRAFARDVLLFGAEHERLLTAGATDRLTEERLADLFLIAQREFPPETDPWHVGVFSPGPRDHVRRWRDGLLSALEGRTTDRAVDALARIAAASPERDWLVQAWLRASAARFGARWAGTPPRTLMRMATQPLLRQVQSGEQLLDLLEESLARLQRELRGELRSVVGLWDEQRPRTRVGRPRPSRSAPSRGGWRPKNEEHLANEVARHVQRDLGERGVIVGRELVVQVGIRGGAAGLRTDLDIRARPAGETCVTIPDVRVIIEVKGSWHPEILTAMRTQLVNDYLESLEVRHGMFLVGEYTCDAWEDSAEKARSARLGGPEVLARCLTEQARELSTPLRMVRAVVLDVSLPPRGDR